MNTPAAVNHDALHRGVVGRTHSEGDGLAGAADEPAALGARQLSVTGAAASPIESTIVASSLRLPAVVTRAGPTVTVDPLAAAAGIVSEKVAGPDVTGGATGVVALDTSAPSVWNTIAVTPTLSPTAARSVTV